MPRETDKTRLEIVARVLSDRAAVLFQRKALAGGERPDEGAQNLLPTAVGASAYELRERVREALVQFMARGACPNRVDVPGDAERGDPPVFYEFRVTIDDVRLYIKTELKEDDPTYPLLVVKSVKRQY